MTQSTRSIIDSLLSFDKNMKNTLHNGIYWYTMCVELDNHGSEIRFGSQKAAQGTGTYPRGASQQSERKSRDDSQYREGVLHPKRIVGVRDCGNPRGISLPTILKKGGQTQ